MQLPPLRLTSARRAGLLAAVAVYPLSRLDGTLPRATLDRALVSGASMGVAFQAAAATTGVLHRITATGAPSPAARALRTATAAGALAAGAAVLAGQTRAAARVAAAERRRLGIPAASVGATAELVTVAAGAGALVALADALGTRVPEHLRPSNRWVMTVSVITAGAGLGAAARHPRVLAHLTLPSADGAPGSAPIFQNGASLPIAIGRSAGVAAATVALLALETSAAQWLASSFGRRPGPGAVALGAAHAVLASGFVVAGTAGFGFYSSRVAVQERLLEGAYAAVPERRGVTGGPDSAYDFGDLGREGRRFVSQAHTAEELIGVLATAATDPVRAWVPLSELTGDEGHDTVAVVAEVERLGGFAKTVIVLAAPTGDGYVSYVHTEAVELLTAGDCTTVAVPYAEVPSAIAFPRRARAAAAYATYARAIATRAHELNPGARLFTFGESLGSIVALDAFGPDVVVELSRIGFHGGLYCGVPIYSKADRALRPDHPVSRESRGLQYASGRDQAVTTRPGHVNLTHPTDPVAVADPSTLVRHPVDYWGRPFGAHVPLVSFLVHLMDVKNAMNLRPGDFQPSLGHDYRFDTAVAVARAYDLPFHQEEVIEAALRERELAWSVRRLLSKRAADARDSAVAKLESWGVDPATVATRFRIPERAVPAWLQTGGVQAVVDDVAEAVAGE